MFFGSTKPRVVLNEFLVNQITSALGISPPFVELVEDNGFFFLVFEFVDADGLKVVLDKYSRSEKQQYLLALARVLRDFHALGFVHRDVKPQNFLYERRSGRAYLIDFGLCEYSPECNRRLPELPRRVQALFAQLRVFCEAHARRKHKMGTDGFLAPEVHFFQKKLISAKTDLWSLGSVAMQVFFGKEFVFTQKMIIYDSRNMRLRNVKNSKLVLVLQLAGLLGTRAVEKFLRSVQVETRLPRVIDDHDLDAVSVTRCSTNTAFARRSGN